MVTSVIIQYDKVAAYTGLLIGSHTYPTERFSLTDNT